MTGNDYEHNIRNINSMVIFTELTLSSYVKVIFYFGISQKNLHLHTKTSLSYSPTTKLKVL